MNPMANFFGMMQKFNEFRQNPIGALMGMGYNVPPHLQNNYEGMVNYLRNSGQMTDQQFNQFSQMAQQFQSQQNNQIKGF